MVLFFEQRRAILAKPDAKFTTKDVVCRSYWTLPCLAEFFRGMALSGSRPREGRARASALSFEGALQVAVPPGRPAAAALGRLEVAQTAREGEISRAAIRVEAETSAPGRAGRDDGVRGPPGCFHPGLQGKDPADHLDQCKDVHERSDLTLKGIGVASCRASIVVDHGQKKVKILLRFRGSRPVFRSSPLPPEAELLTPNSPA